jgi:hypothetical protein
LREVEEQRAGEATPLAGVRRHVSDGVGVTEATPSDLRAILRFA